MIRIVFICILIVIAGAANGVMDTLQFHYPSSRFAQKEKQAFWNPAISWQNKYKRDADGALIRPLVPRFPGSTTILAWTTDAWHLFKTIHFAALRTALVLALSLGIRLAPRRQPRLNVALWCAVWIVLVFIQAAGFHLTYTFFK
jgi:hypothetical protein